MIDEVVRLRLVIFSIKAQMMSGSYIQVDETPIKYFDPGNGKYQPGLPEGGASAEVRARFLEAHQ